MTEHVNIHGSSWKWADVQEPIAWARQQQWKQQKWTTRAALVSKSCVSDYSGQSYNPEQVKLVEDGWTHDHCEICWWMLFESEVLEDGQGYTIDGHKWICTECYLQFLEQ